MPSDRPTLEDMAAATTDTIQRRWSEFKTGDCWVMAEDEIIAVLRRVVEECARANCSWCRDGEPASRGDDGHWMHGKVGDWSKRCSAEAIRERWRDK